MMLTEGSIRVRQGIEFMAAEFSLPAVACASSSQPTNTCPLT
jgi:hypothetical protein